jgi:low temperature requirement protein LtrA
MPIITLIMGLILIASGLGFYFSSESKSATALIPSFVGAPLAIMGALLLFITSNARKHIAHTAALLATLGTLAGLGMGIPGMIKILSGAENARPLAAYASSVLGICCLVVLIASIKSFRAARKAREAL